ncbi:unnamed protein product [Hymenolepis diminuta]|uniref:Uncharacterized protein n=1 Tax=Hymenolepis diminuta TaxID=6216 RepID=A0A564YCF2_HYMDI|nr:unnamed protein product [Hymenolepis diminuta]
MPISLSSRLPYHRRRCHKCKENGHKEGFCRISSTSSSTRQNPKNPDWIDDLNLIHFPDENEICQTFTLESTNAEHLVRGRNQCLHVAEIPSIHIHSPKPDSPKTQP